MSRRRMIRMNIEDPEAGNINVKTTDTFPYKNGDIITATGEANGEVISCTFLSRYHDGSRIIVRTDAGKLRHLKLNDYVLSRGI